MWPPVSRVRVGMNIKRIAPYPNRTIFHQKPRQAHTQNAIQSHTEELTTRLNKAGHINMHLPNTPLLVSNKSKANQITNNNSNYENEKIYVKTPPTKMYCAVFLSRSHSHLLCVLWCTHKKYISIKIVVIYDWQCVYERAKHIQCKSNEQFSSSTMYRIRLSSVGFVL